MNDLVPEAAIHFRVINVIWNQVDPFVKCILAHR